MTIGIVGVKSGMTRVFAPDGGSIPVTVVHAIPNRITQIKTADSDAYEAVQVVHGERPRKSGRHSRGLKPVLGHWAKSETEAGDRMHEFRLDRHAVNTADSELELGGELSVSQFFEGQRVDVTGTSKGKGFAGVIKRWNFQRQDMTHGNSLSHRGAGSIGQCQTPGRVFKGKKMAGRLGNAQATTQNLEIVKLDLERNTILIKGSIPGASGSRVIVRPAIKQGVQTPPETKRDHE
ncbi:MAG: 50S ribosomal protein L3 [Gammaproteobacteria bacterium]|nr:50S ribosomal protein L3 [Gammaproteobacteria bacterium]MYC25469.1 50S ribosomal protein L3 [Gammaproteobacteria bacterium]